MIRVNYIVYNENRRVINSEKYFISQIFYRKNEENKTENNIRICFGLNNVEFDWFMNLSLLDKTQIFNIMNRL